MNKAFGATLAVLLTTAAHGWAETSPASRTLFRGTEVTGLPRYEIDLEKPARQKYALIIGNADYGSITDLQNTVNDARRVANLLESAGYTVVDYYDLDKRGFEGAMRRTLFDLEIGSELVVYYAGHGLQIGGRNYLLPTDANIDTIYDVPFEAVSLSSILRIAGARARSVVFILDSCRNNPFPGGKAIVGLDDVPEEMRTGFSAQDTPINTLLVYSTSPGAVALDGEGDNSPFTEALAEVLESRPGAPFDELMKEVRRIVYTRTAGLQVPWESSSLVEQIAFQTGSFPVGRAKVAEMVDGQVPDVSINVALNPKVRVGPGLMASIPMQGAGTVALAAAPAGGRLELDEDGTLRNMPATGVEAVALSNLIYNTQTVEQSAPAMRGLMIVDTFQLAMNDTPTTVQVNMEVDPCDFQAGDYLDPEGVGVARYPNEIEPETALAACREAVAREPDNGRFHYQLGRAQLALLDYDGAEASFRRASELGHTRAWYGLGTIEFARIQGSGGRSDERAPDAVLDLFRNGVERGDPYAFHSLGRQLLQHPRNDVERREGFELLTRSLELGHTFSMNALGTYFLEDGSDHFDPERGLRYYTESAARGDIYGYANMGFAYRAGIGSLEPDMVTALDYYTRAAQGGHPTAPAAIARLFEKGDVGGKPNFAKAMEWYDEGLSRGDGWGGANGAWLIASEAPDGYTIWDAAVRAAKAAALRNTRAAESARDLLTQLDGTDLDAASQALMAELGEQVTVDGAFGPGSQEALRNLSIRFSEAIPADGVERLVMLARLYWRTNKFRVDLY